MITQWFNYSSRKDSQNLTNSQTNGPPAKHHTLWVLRNAEHGRGSGPSRSSFSSNGLPANMQKSHPCKLTGPETQKHPKCIGFNSPTSIPRMEVAYGLLPYLHLQMSEKQVTPVQVFASDIEWLWHQHCACTHVSCSWIILKLIQHSEIQTLYWRCFIMFDGFWYFFCFYGIELNIQPSWLGLAHVLPNTRGASPPMSRA